MRATIFKTFITGRQAIAMTFVFAIVIASVATILVSCSARRNASPPEAMTDEGVVINGVRWATRNADGYRTFVSSPEVLGGFYAWNRNRARDRYTLGRSMLQRGSSQGNSFEPCPPGWRLPTVEEFESLIAAGSVWVEKNGVNGRLFGTAPNQLFLPAAGRFLRSPDELRNVNMRGFYWVDKNLTSFHGRMLNFSQEGIDISMVPRFRTTQLQGNPSHSAIRELNNTGQFNIYSSPFIEIPSAIPPELSVRCVAVTDDD